MAISLAAIWSVLSEAAPFLKGKDDYPKLKNGAGQWLDLHYMQHCRASADDLSKVWKDGHTICDNATGVPVARWSFSKQEIEYVTGFTVQGLPVYEAVDAAHPVWTTVRAVPSHLGSPGSEGQTIAYRGSIHYRVPQPVPYRRGQKLADYMGSFGPLNEGTPVEDPGGDPGEQEESSINISMILGLGAVMAAVSGAWVPAIMAGAGAVLLGGSTGSRRGGDWTPSPGSWQREPGMTDEEAEASWHQWLEEHPQEGRGREA